MKYIKHDTTNAIIEVDQNTLYGIIPVSWIILQYKWTRISTIDHSHYIYTEASNLILFTNIWIIYGVFRYLF